MSKVVGSVIPVMAEDADTLRKILERTEALQKLLEGDSAKKELHAMWEKVCSSRRARCTTPISAMTTLTAAAQGGTICV